MRTKLSTGVTLLIAAGLSGALMVSALPASAGSMDSNATGRSAVEVRMVRGSDVGSGLTINEFSLNRSTLRSGMKLTAEVVARAPSGVRNVDLIVTDRYGDVTDPGDDAPMQYDLCHNNEMRLVSGTAADGRWKLTCAFTWDPGVYWVYPAVCSNEQKCVYGVEEDQDMVLELTVRR